MTTRKTIHIVSALVVLVAVVAGVPVTANAHSGDSIFSNWATVTPTIDGAMAAGEWDDAGTYNFAGPSGPSTGYVKNDAINLYFAFWISDLTGAGDEMRLLFDDGHDGVLSDPGEDDKRLIGGDGLVDYHFEFMTWGVMDNTHGSTASVYTASTGWVFELSMPLKSGEVGDLSTSPGDTVGYASIFWDTPSNLWYKWPAGLDPAWEDTKTFGDIVLSRSGGVATGVPVFPSLYVGIAAAFGAGILAYLFRRRLTAS